jgi:UvrB/uvrC motif
VTKDIQPILDGWDFEPGSVNVRIVRGLEGREKVQMRVDLGLLQMEMGGRPDGTRPHGAESFLDHLDTKARTKDKRSEEFHLSDGECEELLREGVQYYYRYLSFFHLGRYDLAARDTQRNLRLFAFVRQYATTEQAKWRFDQYRPYVLMMNTRARALPTYEAKRYRESIEIVAEGIAAIREFLVEHELQDQEDECLELEFLKRWRDEIDRARPLDATEKLQRQLDNAIRNENYERAAQLRDQIRKRATSRSGEDARE